MVTGPEQHAATVRLAFDPRWWEIAKEAEASLDELVALAVNAHANARLAMAAEARADELERGLDQARSMVEWDASSALRAKAAEEKLEQARREADQLRAALVGAQFCLVVEYNRYRDSTPTDPGEIVGREEGMEIIGETLNEIAALIGPYYAEKVAALAGAPSGPSEADRLRATLERAGQFQPRRVEWFRANGIVFDRAPNGDVTDWQNIAFHVYTDLCEVEAIARAALDGVQADNKDSA